MGAGFSGGGLGISLLVSAIWQPKTACCRWPRHAQLPLEPGRAARGSIMGMMATLTCSPGGGRVYQPFRAGPPRLAWALPATSPAHRHARAPGDLARGFAPLRALSEAELRLEELLEAGGEVEEPIQPLPGRRRRLSRRFAMEKAKFPGKEHPLRPEEAVLLVKASSSAKFDESVELHARLNINPKYPNQQLRATVTLPKGTGRRREKRRGNLGFSGRTAPFWEACVGGEGGRGAIRLDPLAHRSKDACPPTVPSLPLPPSLAHHYHYHHHHNPSLLPCSPCPRRAPRQGTSGGRHLPGRRRDGGP